MSADMSVIRETTLLTDGDEPSTLTPPPGNVDPGDVLYHKLIITNGGTTDATEVSIEDTFSGETMVAGTLNISPIAFNNTYTAVGNTVLRVGLAGQEALGANGNPSGNPSLIVNANILSNDRGSSTIGTGVIGGDNIAGFQVRPATGASAQQGSFTIFADGSFTYVNQAGDTGVDTFQYTIEDAGLDGNYATTADNLTSTATVSINLTGEVWYVDASATSNGTGTSANPFNSIDNLNAANKDGVGDTIYVEGTNAVPAAGKIVLEADQQLIGTGADLKVAGFTLATAGANSYISANAAGNYTVNVATNNTIAGINIVGAGSNTGGIGENQAGNFGTLSLNPSALNAGNPAYTSTINSTGTAINLSAGTIAGNGFSSTTSTSGLVNVLLNNIAGTLNLGGGTLSGATGINSTEGNLTVIGGSVNVNYSGTVSSAVFDVAAVNIRSGHTGTVTLDGNVTATNGLGLLFADADGTYNLNGVVSLTGPGNAGIDIVGGSSGTFTFGTPGNLATITNNAGQDAFVVTNSNANVTYNGTITDNNSNAVNIDNHDGGTITFQNGSINSTGGAGIDVTNSNSGTVNFNSQVTVSTGALAGVNLVGNTGSAINFNATGNGLDITTTTGTGFNATGGGTIRVSASGTNDLPGGNTITSAGGTALNVNGTTIGSGGLVFQKISATGGSVDGISLSDTGTTAGLTITGTGTADSGGTISGMTGQNNDGISLNNTVNFNASWLRIDNVGGHGINATNLGGSNSIANSKISDWNSDQTASATKDGLHLVNTNNSTTMIVTNTTFDGSEVNSATVTGNDGVFMEAQGTGAMNLRVEDSVFTHMYGDGIQVGSTGGSTGTVNVRIIDNDFTNSVPYSGGPGVGGGNGGISIQPFGGTVGGAAQQFTVLVSDNVLSDIRKPVTNVGAIGGTVGQNVNADITVQNNTISNILAGRGITFTVDGGDADIKIIGNSVNSLGDNSKHAINVNFTDNGALGTTGHGDVQIVGNFVGNTGQLYTNPDVTGAEAVMVQTQGSSTMTALMSGNTITANTPFEVLRAKAGGTSVMNVTITGNTLNDTDTASRDELDVTAGYISGQGGTINASISGNTIAAGGDIELKEQQSGTLNIDQDSQAQVSSLNGNASVVLGGTPQFGQATPPQPADPLLPPNFLFADAIPLADEPAADTTGGGAPSGGDITNPPAPQPEQTPVMPPAPAGPAVVDDMVLSQAELDLIVDAAIARWAAAGATDAQVAAMRATVVTVSDLGGLMLGESGLGTIRLDDNAGGWNWFVDSTPGDDSEYAGSGTRLGAVDGQSAAGTRMDLLTVVTHELGHQIGLEDSYALTDRSQLMYGTISAGERRLAGGDDVAYAGDGPVTGAFAFSPIDLGTIPAGRTVVVEWRAIVDTPNEDRLVSAVLGQGILSYRDTSDPVDPTGFKTELSNAQSFSVDSLTLGNLVYTDINKDGDYDAGTDALMSGVTLKLYADSNNSGFYESGTDLAIVFFDANANGTYEQGIDEARAAGTTGANIVQLSATTNASGIYAFNSLAPGDYIVVVDASNFGAGVLGSRRAHPGAVDPDDADTDNNIGNVQPADVNIDGDNNAQQFLPGDPGTYAATRAIRLDYGLEPTPGPVGPAGDTNNTLDIGFDLPNQPPAIGALNGDTVTFTEDAGPIVIDQGANATVDDPEDGDFDLGTLTVQITANRVDAEDVLSLKNGGNITIDYLNGKVLYSGVEMATFAGGSGGDQLVVTFNATASETRVQELIRLVTYENADQESPNTTARTVTWTLVDGDGTANGGNETATATTTINLVAVNDFPFGEDKLDVPINEDQTYVFKYVPVGNPGAVNDFGFSDTDGNAFAGVRIVDLPLLGKIKLNGVDVVANQVISATDIQNGLLTYTPALNGSGNDYASFTFQVIDDGSNVAPNDNEDNAADTFRFDVAAVNDAPQSTGFDNVSFTEGAFYVQLDTGFDQVLTDVDSANFDGGSLTARVSVNEVASEDVVDFLTGGTSFLAISGNTISYNNVAFATFSRGVGQDLVFNFDSDATVQAVQTLMRNLVYVNTNQSQPSTATRTIEYILTDGDGGSLTLNSTVAVSTINDAPVLNGLGETLFDNLPANSAVRYSISANQLGDDFVLAQDSTVRSITVQLSDGVANNDGLFNAFSGTISWAIYADGGDRPGALIASGSDAAALVRDTGLQTPTNADIFYVDIDLGQNLALAAGSYWVALHENAWGSASDGTSISWVTASNGSGDSAVYGSDLAAPPAAWGVDIYRDLTLRVNGPAAPVTFAENLVNAAPQIIDADVALTDPEGNVATGTVTVGGLLGEDRVAIRHEGTDVGQIGVSGTNVTYSGTTIGSFSGGTGTNFVVALNGAATPAAVDALIQNLTYANVSNFPTASRTLSVTVADGFGAANSDWVAINVTGENDAPALDLNGAAADVNSTAVFAEDGSEVLLAAAAILEDVDSANLTGATVSVTSGFQATTDYVMIGLSTFGDIGSIHYEYNDSTGVLTLSGTATVADYQAVLRQVTFMSISHAPGTARTVTWSVTDGTTASAPVTTAITVNATNDAPTVSGDGTEALAGVNEDSVSNDPAGHQSVAQIFGGQFSDVDGDTLAGVAVVGNDASGTNGQWQYWNGATWTDIGAASDDLAVPLAAATKVRFLPNAEYNGAAPTLTVRLVDSSGGALANGGTVDADPNGGTTRYSSGVVTLDQNIAGINDNPLLDMDGAGGVNSAAGYAYEQDPTGTGSIAFDATVSDVDSADFAAGTLTVGFTANAQAGDTIVLPNSNGIMGHEVSTAGGEVSYNGTVIGTYTEGDHDTPLVVTFDADATPEAVQYVVRAVRVVHTSDAPSPATRSLSYDLTDGDGGSASGTATVAITADNDAPASTAPTSAAIGFTENAGTSTPLMQGVVLSDVDLPANFAGGSLNINVSGGEGGINLKAGSLFSIAADGIGGFDLVYDNGGTPVIIGKIAGFGTANMTVSAFTSEGTLARLNDLVDDFGYILVGDNPTPGDKIVTMTFNDGNNVGNGGTLAKTTVETQTLTVTVSNDLPVLDLDDTDASFDSAVAYAENDPTVLLAPNAAVSDLDDANMEAATVTISAGRVTGDQLTLGGLLSGNTGTGGAIAFGYDASTGVLSLSGTASKADYQAALRLVGFSSASDDPGTARTVSWTLNDGTSPSTGRSTTITITASDDTPVAQDDTGSTVESATTSVAVLTNDTDPDGPPIQIAEIAGVSVVPGGTVNLASGATATLDIGGTSITYNPNGAFNWLTDNTSGAVNTSAVDNFTYKLVGGTATANVAVTVNGQASADDILYGDTGNNVITGTPQRDIFYVQQGGNDTVHGLATGDTFYFGKEFTAADTVNGGGGADSIILQGNYPALTLGTGLTSNINSVETISLAPGDITSFGDTANAFYDYNITTLNSNVAAGELLKINGFYLRAGEDFTFNGAAETDGQFILLAGQGVDNLTGGGQSDIFVFGHDGRFGSSDVVNGGGGYDSLYLRGDYALDFTSAGFTGSISGIESITLGAASDTQFITGGDGEFDYSIVWKDSMLATGSTVTVNGSGLGINETMVFNGAGEAGGHFRLWGGAAADTLTGGGGNDLIYGGRGADQLRGNGGADTFRYQATNESAIGNFDTIFNFTHGVDTIDLSVIDAKTTVDGNQAFTFIGAAAFTAAGPSTAGQLRVVQADVLTNHWEIHGDTDGNGVADFVLQVFVEPLQSLTVSDLVL